MHQKFREDGEKDEAAGILPNSDTTGGGRGGGRGGGGGVGASATIAARSRRLRAKNEPCVLPDRLLHRVRAPREGKRGGNGALAKVVQPPRKTI